MAGLMRDARPQGRLARPVQPNGRHAPWQASGMLMREPDRHLVAHLCRQPGRGAAGGGAAVAASSSGRRFAERREERTGLIGMLTALVLGLLVASAQGSYQIVSNQLNE